MNYPSPDNGFHNRQAALICESYQLLLRESLLNSHHPFETQAEALFHAPFAVLSHTVDTDPVFNYVNLNAMELFEFTWDEFIGIPSRLSAAPACQADRDRLLKEVSLNGYIKDYQGVRLRKTGGKFLIKNSVVWNLCGDRGNYAGQAACLIDWEFL
ncbi:MAG: MEKHLA domain-containing protein [Methylococcaceae bacterium]|nr:MEKHLA domain-containing protein [Methylococcaceae bacterium]